MRRQPQPHESTSESNGPSRQTRNQYSSGPVKLAGTYGERLDGESRRLLFGFRCAAKAITDPRFRQDVYGILGIQLYLLAQILDDGAQVVYLVAVIRTPYG